MPDKTPVEPPPSLLLYAHAVYALYAAGFIFPALWVIGILVAFVKRDSAKETWLYSHFQWQIKTFLWGLLGLGGLLLFMYTIQFLISHSQFSSLSYALTGVLYALGIAWLIWLCYRVARGWAMLNMRREC